MPEDGSRRMSVTAGRPTVRVPVLSNTTLSTLDAASRMSPPLISSPLHHRNSCGLSSNGLYLATLHVHSRGAVSMDTPAVAQAAQRQLKMTCMARVAWMHAFYTRLS